MIDKFPLIVDDFKGVRAPDSEAIGNIEDYQFDSVGINEAYESTNIRFLKNKGFRTRPGYTGLLSIDLGITNTLVQTWQVKNLKGVNQTNRWLVLGWDATNGKIYDTGSGTPTVPILTVAGMKYAFVINAFGRMYISPWSDWGVPLDTLGIGAVDRVYVWNGDYVPRKAQGAALDRTTNWPPAANAPTSVVNSGTAGNVVPGTHLFDVAYEYDTGWISPLYGATESFEGGPPSTQPLNLVCTGNQITINHIPTGAAGTGITARYVIMSALVTNYDGFGWLHYEPFFAIKIDDNTTVGPFTFDMPDAGLVESASYLLDGLGIIYSCISMGVSNNRMIYYGPKSSPGGTVDLPIQEAAHCILISPPGDPERVNPYGDDGSRIIVGRDFTSGVNCGAELRGVNYVFKGSSTWAFREDINLDPSEWAIDLVDAGIGAFPLGVSKIGSSLSSVVDESLIVGGSSGIFIFSGAYSPTPISLGWWSSYTSSDLKYLKILVNPLNKLIFCPFRDPAGTGTIGGGDFIWAGDFSYGLSYDTIRWAKDQIGLDRRFSGKIHLYEGITGSILDSIKLVISGLDLDLAADFSIYIEDLASEDEDKEHANETVLITGYTPTNEGNLYTFTTARVRALTLPSVQSQLDSGLAIEATTIDNNTFTGETKAVGSGPDKFIDFSLLNRVAEKIRLKIYTSGGTRCMVNKLIIFANQRGESRVK